MDRRREATKDGWTFDTLPFSISANTAICPSIEHRRRKQARTELKRSAGREGAGKEGSGPLEMKWQLGPEIPRRSQSTLSGPRCLVRFLLMGGASGGERPMQRNEGTCRRADTLLFGGVRVEYNALVPAVPCPVCPNGGEE